MRYADRTYIMGIINVTPDSFSDGGKYYDSRTAVMHGLQLIKEGADILDIGGESTRPGADPVNLEEELRRVIPVIEELRKKTDLPISIDTYKSAVARKALEAGASMVNDISGLTYDNDMMTVVKQFHVPVVVMHIKGTPKNMQKDPHYDDLFGEISFFFKERIHFLLENGLSKENIIIDPGIGFGKTYDDNFRLLKNLKTFTRFGVPVLIGPSRKRFIGETLNLPENDRVEGTAAAVTAGILNGANIVRVHDVRQMKRIALIADKICKA